MLEIPAELGLEEGIAEPIAGGKVSRVWRCRLDGRDVAVRQSPRFRTIEEVDYEWAVLRALHLAGAPVAEPLGDPVAVGGSVWTVFEWVEGVQPARSGMDPAPFGTLLAELHSFTSTLDLGQRPRWCRVDQFLTHPRGDGSLTLEDALDEFEAKTGARRLASFARAVHERLAGAGCDGLPQTIAHGDFGPHQVIVRDDDSMVVIDWDFCHVDLRAADIAIGSTIARPTAGRAASLLKAYGALEPEELGMLADLRRAFHLNNLANQVCALWVHGVDVSGALDAITERLDREQWWGPTLLAGARAAPAVATSPSTDLDVALELADRAAVVAMHWFTEGVVAERKADDSPVTEADRAVERLLRHGLEELRPDDAILGEELGVAGTGARRWILDPIDGTSAFAVGGSDWRIQIALEVDGEIVVAVVDAPATATRWWATKDGGAFESQDGQVRALRMSTREKIEGARVHTHPVDLVDRMPPQVVVAPRSGQLSLIDLVRGEIDAFYVDCCEVWDHAPWVLLVREAGGAFTDHDGGGAADKRGGLYSNALMHEALFEAIRRRR